MNISDDDMVLNFLKRLPCILEKDLNVLAKITYNKMKTKAKISNIFKSSTASSWAFKKIIKQEPEIQDVNTVPQHLQDWLRRRLKYKPAKIICDEEFLKEFPYLNRKIKVKKTDKIKRREAII